MYGFGSLVTFIGRFAAIVSMIKPVEWTDKHTQIIKDYERRKQEGTIKEYVLIEKGDIEERLSQAFPKSIPFSNIIRPSKKNE